MQFKQNPYGLNFIFGKPKDTRKPTNSQCLVFELGG